MNKCNPVCAEGVGLDDLQMSLPTHYHCSSWGRSSIISVEDKLSSFRALLQLPNLGDKGSIHRRLMPGSSEPFFFFFFSFKLRIILFDD